LAKNKLIPLENISMKIFPPTRGRPGPVAKNISEIKTVMVKKADSGKDGTKVEKIEVSVDDFVESVKENGVAESARKFGLDKMAANNALSALRRAGLELEKLPYGGNARVRIKDEKKKMDRLQSLKPASARPALIRPVPIVDSYSIPKEHPVQLSPPPPPPANPISKGGIGNRVQSMRAHLPPEPFSKLPVIKKSNYSSLGEQETGRVLREVPVARVSMVSRVASTSAYRVPAKKFTKDPERPLFSKKPSDLRIAQFIRDDDYFIYYSSTQATALWLHCPKYVLTDPEPEFSTYLGHSVNISSSSLDKLVGDLRKLHSDIHFLGVGKLIRGGTLKPKRNKTPETKDE
jgi:DNA-binding transcriptional ArsR family regulator